MWGDSYILFRLFKIPLQSFHKVCLLVLICSDQVYLITLKEPICQGTRMGPVAVCTTLGWAFQGAVMELRLFLSTSHPDDIHYRNVERLWQLDVLPFRNKKLVVWSKKDKGAMHLPESQTQQVTVKGVQRYATPFC